MSMPGLSQAETMILQGISALETQVANLRDQLQDLKGASQSTLAKDWYTTKELSQALGLSAHHVRERFCNQGRIECEKHPVTGKWRIPGHEFERLRRGGLPDYRCARRKGQTADRNQTKDEQ